MHHRQTHERQAGERAKFGAQGFPAASSDAFQPDHQAGLRFGKSKADLDSWVGRIPLTQTGSTSHENAFRYGSFQSVRRFLP